MRDIESMVEVIEATGRFKVLRKLQPRRTLRVNDGTKLYEGIFVDCETTGLDHRSCEIIEIALVPFRFSLDGRVFEVLSPYVARQEPRGEVPEVVQRLTGLTSDDLRGKTIDDYLVEATAAHADLVIAHHADFDRRFIEHRFPIFASKPWACSMKDVNWKAEGFESTKLSYLAMKCGFFYAEHNAAFDALAGIELLNTELVSTGRPAMAQLIEKLQKDTTRLAVQKAPFKLNGLLRDRGYRFEREQGKAVWTMDIETSELSEEERFLRDVGLTSTNQHLSPLNRFSDRLGLPVS